MNKYQPISQKSKISNWFGGAFFLTGGLAMTLLPLYILFTEGYSSLEWSGIVVMVFGGLAIIFAISIFFIKKELTPDSQKELKQQSKEWEEKLMKKWYVRYPASIFALALAYVCYVAYTKGLDFSGKPLVYIVINPVIGIIMVITAIFHAWEISLTVITLVVLYYLYLGIAALPISVAIIVGSIIIAYGIYKYKA